MLQAAALLRHRLLSSPMPWNCLTLELLTSHSLRPMPLSNHRTPSFEPLKLPTSHSLRHLIRSSLEL